MERKNILNIIFWISLLLVFIIYMTNDSSKDMPSFSTITIVDYNTEETIDVSKSRYKLVPNINNKININGKQYTVRNVAYNYADNQLKNVQIIVE